MLRRDRSLERLSTIDALAHLPKRVLRRVCSITTLVHLPAGAVLWEQGDRAEEALMLLTGELELTLSGTPLETVGPGAMIGGIGLTEAAPRVATAKTLTDVEALVLSRTEYRQLVRLWPEVAGRVQAAHRARFSQVGAATVLA